MIRVFMSVIVLLSSGMVTAAAFTADAVQIRNGDFTHARLFWTDDKVRFEYVDNGVSMAQIYDTSGRKVFWLDTDRKVYMQSELPENKAVRKLVQKRKLLKTPCEAMEDAECTRLKDADVEGRKATKWLITLSFGEEETHIFQWVDKQYGVILKQINPDGSMLNARIEEDVELNGRKARKIDMVATTNMGMTMRSSQWYDKELDVVIKQVFADGSIDELRNITIEDVQASKFEVPVSYTKLDRVEQTSDIARDSNQLEDTL